MEAIVHKNKKDSSSNNINVLQGFKQFIINGNYGCHLDMNPMTDKWIA
jgi:hypothetical protein